MAPWLSELYRQAQGINDDVFSGPMPYSLLPSYKSFLPPECGPLPSPDTAFIQCQRNHNAAVLLYQREYRAWTLLFPFTELMSGLPLYTRMARSMATGSVVSSWKRQVNDALQ